MAKKTDRHVSNDGKTRPLKNYLRILGYIINLFLEKIYQIHRDYHIISCEIARCIAVNCLFKFTEMQCIFGNSGYTWCVSRLCATGSTTVCYAYHGRVTQVSQPCVTRVTALCHGWHKHRPREEGCETSVGRCPFRQAQCPAAHGFRGNQSAQKQVYHPLFSPISYDLQWISFYDSPQRLYLIICNIELSCGEFGEFLLKKIFYSKCLPKSFIQTMYKSCNKYPLNCVLRYSRSEILKQVWYFVH